MARDNRLDSVKGLLMILVVLGHVITVTDNDNVFNHAVMGLIYVFHMPLFILISGYLTKNPEQQRPQDMWRGVGNIFITLLIFHLISAFRSYLNTGSFFTAFLKFPYGILWYLMCLIYWRVALYYTPKSLLRRPVLYLGLALAVLLLCGLTRLGNTLALQRGLNFYFFFLLGYYFRQGAVNARWWHSNILHIAMAVVLLPLIFWLYPHCGNIMNGADYYTLADVPQKALILACSVAMSLIVFNNMREVKLMTLIGKESLFYYVYHFLVIVVLLLPIVHKYDLPVTLPFEILYALAVLGVVFLMSKIKFFKWLVNPFKYKKKYSPQ
ncbi:MAG: acyltransferase family protein [Muribaculaceae bacterium]|nr:acyltransferase family protein [Muribaculaceae bacterium]